MRCVGQSWVDGVGLTLLVPYDELPNDTALELFRAVKKTFEWEVKFR